MKHYSFQKQSQTYTAHPFSTRQSNEVKDFQNRLLKQMNVRSEEKTVKYF